MAPVTKKKISNKRSNSGDDKVAKKAKISVESSDEDEQPQKMEVDESSSDDDLDDIVSDDNDDEDDEGEDKSAEKSVEKAGEKGDGSNHGEQRKLLKERKLKRKSGNEIEQIKVVWERLRVKSPPLPKEIREKLSNEIWNLAKDVIADLVLKHDASRIVQTLIKYSSKERREQIVDSLKGKFYVLATSSYGKYLLVKLLHYGSRNSRQAIINELHGNLRKLMRHREGAYVVEDLFVLYATHEQRQQMIKEFWGSEYAVFREDHAGLTLEDVCAKSMEKRSIIARNLIGTITASVEKGSTGFQILHAAMREYVKIANEKEISEIIELLHEQFAELVHTPEGSEVACTLIAKATAKERKQILKGLKDHGEKLIKNEFGNLVFTTILLTVDDTVLVFKTFGPAVKENFYDFVIDKYGRRPFLYLLVGLDGKYFSPIVKKDLLKYIEMSKATSKKDDLVRRHELLKKFAPIFLSVIAKEYLDVLLENLGSQYVSEILTNDEAYELLDENSIKTFNDVVSSIITAFKGDIADKDHPIHLPFNTRLLKTLIQGGKWNNKEKKLQPVQKVKGLGIEFAQTFYEDIIDSSNLLEWINTPDSSFTIVALYEALKDHKEGKQFLKDLKSIQSQIETDGEPVNKGAQLLVKLLK